MLRRVGGAVLGQSGFVGYHFVVLTIAFLTWLPFWGATLRALGRGLLGKTPLQERSLVIWVVMGWFFWELMSSKLPSYALGAQPALALLMALQLEQLAQKEQLPTGVRILRGVYLLLFGVLIISLPLAGGYAFGNQALWALLPMSFALSVLLVRHWQQPVTLNNLYQQLALFGAAFMLGLWLCVTPLVEQSPVKALDRVVATAARATADPQTTALYLTGLDRKQFKISLLFYAEQEFGSYTLASPLEAMSKFKEAQPVVIVVGETGYDELQKAFIANKIPFQATQIPYRSTDDELRRHDYWVLSNQNSGD